MRVAVTGGSGLLGRFVVDELVGSHAVTVVDKADAGRADVVFHAADVLDLAALERPLDGCDALIHLAAIDAGNPFPDETYFRTNVLGTWNVLTACERAGIAKVVIASSSSVYGLDRVNAPDYLPIDESHPLRPTGVYALSKVLIEATAQSFARRGALRVICLRPAHIVRPETEEPIVAQVALEDGDPIALARAARSGAAPYGPLPDLRGYVRSRDAGRAFRLALDYDARPFDVFNIMAPDTMGQCDIRDKMQQLFGRIPPQRDPERYAASRCASAFDATSAATALAWQASSGWS